MVNPSSTVLPPTSRPPPQAFPNLVVTVRYCLRNYLHQKEKQAQFAIKYVWGIPDTKSSLRKLQEWRNLFSLKSVFPPTFSWPRKLHFAELWLWSYGLQKHQHTFWETLSPRRSATGPTDTLASLLASLPGLTRICKRRRTCPHLHRPGDRMSALSGLSLFKFWIQGAKAAASPPPNLPCSGGIPIEEEIHHFLP